MYKYEIIVYWSADDEAYIAEVPELPGCMADGESYGAAVQNAEVAIGLALRLTVFDATTYEL